MRTIQCRVLLCKSVTVHLRVGGGLANRGLSTVLLQIADVSASSTSCGQALKHRDLIRNQLLSPVYYRSTRQGTEA